MAYILRHHSHCVVCSDIFVIKMSVGCGSDTQSACTIYHRSDLMVKDVQEIASSSHTEL